MNFKMTRATLGKISVISNSAMSVGKFCTILALGSFAVSVITAGILDWKGGSR